MDNELDVFMIVVCALWGSFMVHYDPHCYKVRRSELLLDTVRLDLSLMWSHWLLSCHQNKSTHSGQAPKMLKNVQRSQKNFGTIQSVTARKAMTSPPPSLSASSPIKSPNNICHGVFIFTCLIIKGQFLYSLVWFQVVIGGSIVDLVVTVKEDNIQVSGTESILRVSMFILAAGWKKKKEFLISLKVAQQLIAVYEWDFIGSFQSVRRFRNENIFNRVVPKFSLGNSSLSLLLCVLFEFIFQSERASAGCCPDFVITTLICDWISL